MTKIYVKPDQSLFDSLRGAGVTVGNLSASVQNEMLMSLEMGRETIKMFDNEINSLINLRKSVAEYYKSCIISDEDAEKVKELHYGKLTKED